MSSSSSTKFSSSSSSSDDERYPITLNIALATICTQATILMQQDEAESSTAPKKRRTSVNRNRLAAHNRLVVDYFSDSPMYEATLFEQRYRMRRELFLSIVNALESRLPYFRLAWDGRGKRGFTPLQKCTSAIRQLAYGTAPDSYDEYLKMSARTSRECLQNFCKGIITIFGNEYLRKPTLNDRQRLYATHESTHGFPGMLGSIDCTHWVWRNCPIAWRGQYMRGDHPYPTIMLEAVASHDLWIWHAFFGVAGSNNDINVLNQSPVFNDMLSGESPLCPFDVNGVTYRHGYYLADGIYPSWSTIVKTFTFPQDAKRQRFKQAQESARKDVERAFGVLKQKWQIIQNPARPMKVSKIRNIMYACIILHNMIIKDSGRAISNLGENDIIPPRNPTLNVDEAYLNRVRELHSSETHNNLRSDLVEHIARTHISNLDR